jgi:hypothetical protein
MSTRNNQLPAPVEPPFPEVDSENEALPAISSNMSLAQIDSVLGRMTTLEDLIEAGIPQQVAQDMIDSDVTGGAPAGVVNDLPAETEVRRAEPVLRPTGAFMDLGFIEQINNAPTDDEAKAMYDSLDPAMRRVYDRSYGMNVSPEWAAGVAQEYYQEQDERVKAASDPRNQALEIQRNEKAQATRDQIGIMRGVVSSILEHPGFSGSIGAKNASYLFGAKSQPFAGTKEADFMALLEQLKGGAFLQAFQSLKGGGPITDVEGEKATQAIVRAQASQSEEGFRKSMNEVMEVLTNAEKRLGDGAATPAQTPNAAAPAVAPQTKKVGNQTWVRTPDGWLPQR